MRVSFLEREVNVDTGGDSLNCGTILSMIDKVAKARQEFGMPFEDVKLFLLKRLY